MAQNGDEPEKFTEHMHNTFKPSTRQHIVVEAQRRGISDNEYLRRLVDECSLDDKADKSSSLKRVINGVYPSVPCANCKTPILFGRWNYEPKSGQKGMNLCEDCFGEINPPRNVAMALARKDQADRLRRDTLEGVKLLSPYLAKANDIVKLPEIDKQRMENSKLEKDACQMFLDLNRSGMMPTQSETDDYMTELEKIRARGRDIDREFKRIRYAAISLDDLKKTMLDFENRLPVEALPPPEDRPSEESGETEDEGQKDSVDSESEGNSGEGAGDSSTRTDSGPQ